MDPGRVNGGVFLGLDGVVIKSHGGADAESFAGAIEVGYDMVAPGTARQDSRHDRPGQRSARARRRGGDAVNTSPLGSPPFMNIAKLRSIVRGVGACLPPRICRNAEMANGRHLRRVDRAAHRHPPAPRRRRRARRRRLWRPAPPRRRSPTPGCRRRHRSDHRRHLDARLYVSGGRDPGAGGAADGHGVAFDLQAVCSGFVFAVATADKFLVSGSHKRALVIGAETFSRLLDWTDRTTCVLFGDGAGAIVLEAAPATAS